MSLILVTGRSGSGKSTLAKMLAERTGFKYLDVDKIGHSLYGDRVVLERAEKLFGRAIFDDDGKFNRKKLGKIFFEERESERVKEFSDYTWECMEKKIDLYQNEDVVLDWILLPNTKYWNGEAVKILVAAESDEKRFDKIIQRDNISLKYLKSREKAGIDYKKEDFDFVIINDYKEGCLEKGIEKIIQNLAKEKNL